MNSDTITAISSAMSPSGIGIIRVSGPDAFDIIEKIYQPKNEKKKIKEVNSHTIHYGHIVNQDAVVDEVLVMMMKGPHTYTGEDTVEINCHGGLLSMKKVLETTIQYGARPAEPGEFTKRAFLSGRIDLSQAEAVMDVIQAKSEYALKSSLSQLKGAVQNSIKDMRSKIIYHIAYIESALDDPEHISIDGYGDTLLKEVKKLEMQADKLLKSADDGKMIQEGIRTVILGKPNAGKSSLLNILVGEEKAIVTDIAGTTRDVLEEQIMLQGISLRMMDTAGIRQTEDKVEKIGVDKAKEYAKDADLILYVVDASVPLDDNDEQIIDLLKEKKAIILLNKSDLEVSISENDLKEKIDAPVLWISAKEEKGIEKLEEKIKELFFSGDINFNDEVYITNVRHKTALQEAKESMELVENSILSGMPEDFYTIDLMNAYDRLGSIIGESVGEDLVNEIFSKFCTGK